MPGESPALVLFDVDGTLIRTEGPSRHTRAFRAAFQQVFGAECRFMPGMHGMTDLQIFMTLAEHQGLANGRLRDLSVQACSSMVQIYESPAEGDGQYVALPGAREILDILSQRGALLGLVTGNAPEIARHKLDSVGLASFFGFGAFGTEAADRSGLPPLAVARAELVAGRRIDAGRVFVVGDTPRDVACALDNGYRAVAVATGFLPEGDLATSGAELVLPNLVDPSPLLRLLGIA